MWDWGAIHLGDHDHYVVDGGKARVILAALVTPADVMENVPSPLRNAAEVPRSAAVPS